MGKTLAFIKGQDNNWTPRFVARGRVELLSMEPVIEAVDQDNALRVLQERYGERLLSHDFAMAELEGTEAPAVVVEIADAA